MGDIQGFSAWSSPPPPPAHIVKIAQLENTVQRANARIAELEKRIEILGGWWQCPTCHEYDHRRDYPPFGECLACTRKTTKPH